MDNPQRVELLRDVVRFMNSNGEPVRGIGEDAMSWWDKANTEMVDMIKTKWKNHPLAMAIFRDIFLDMEKEARG